MKCKYCHWWKVITPPAIGECNYKKKTTTSEDGCNFFKQKFDMPEGFEEIFGGFKKEKEK